MDFTSLEDHDGLLFSSTIKMFIGSILVCSNVNKHTLKKLINRFKGTMTVHCLFLVSIDCVKIDDFYGQSLLSTYVS